MSMKSIIKDKGNEVLIWSVIVGLLLVCLLLAISSPSGKKNLAKDLVATTTLMVATTTSAMSPAIKTIPMQTGTARITTNAAAPAKVAGYNSASYLLGRKESLVCTISEINPYTKAKRTGTMYVASGELRANFSGYINGVPVKSSMINDAKFLYVWTDGVTTGLKLSAVSSASGSTIASHGGIDLTTPFSFSCGSWVVDKNYFIAPSSVTFSNNP